MIRRVVAICIVAVTITTSIPLQVALAASSADVRAAAYDSVYYGTETTAGGSTCSSTPAGAVGVGFSLGRSESERQVALMQALIDEFGFSPEQAAGPVGNFMYESGGKHLPPNINETVGPGAPLFDGGYGWAQWTGGRQVQFIDFAIKNGYMASKTVDATDGANLAYLILELKNGYKQTITELKIQSTPEDAAVSFEATFERAGVPALNPRKENARIAFSAYQQSTGSSSGSLDTSGCNEIVNVNGYVFPLAGTKKVVNNPEIFRANNTDQGGHPYIAYDILADKGTEVVAFLPGVVTYTSIDRCNVRFVTIWNEEKQLGITYMHLSDHIAEGTVVKAGDHVGTIGKGSGDPGCETEHLHIDAATDKIRQGCSRNGCTIQDHFREIGRELYATYQALPE